MKKKISVIVQANELNNIKKGSIINVSRGYALNYLIPNKIAEIATRGKIRQIELFKSINNRKEEAKIVNESITQKNLNKINKICIYKKKGERNLIFGSITEKDIRNWINKYSNLEINNVKVKVGEHKQIGISNIEIIINSRINTIIQLYIIPINI